MNQIFNWIKQNLALILIAIFLTALLTNATETNARINDIDTKIDDVNTKIESLETINSSETVKDNETVKVEDNDEITASLLGTFKLTAYCHCEKCCGKSDGITATGSKVCANRTIAVDPNIIPLGSQVMIDGQIYIAEDVGGAIKGNRIDMYFPTHQEALEFGVQYKQVSMLNGGELS